MWIFSATGFFSVTAAPGRPGIVQVRTRVSADLEALVRRNGGRAKIIHTPSADYPFRVLVGRRRWVRWAAALANDAGDYENFKNEVHANNPERAKLYLEIWRIARELNPPDPVNHSWDTRKNER